MRMACKCKQNTFRGGKDWNIKNGEEINGKKTQKEVKVKTARKTHIENKRSQRDRDKIYL